ncbi:hypothetical protein J437_LFUL013310 [Ladona fulva]|uniref:phospholipase A2 n=1 Tax=Ladona fulva TaxID=123851 RepID=A0A8K0P4E9_LADFU|nr:hypothetical protein J437_LFUL013310 [Ladona fulva]
MKFYQCLKAAGTMTANQIGFAYFNMIETKCFKEDYPIIRCHQYSSALKHRCKVYQLDKSKPKIWEWFDVPIY